MELKQYIRNIPDYPKDGILFRDITSLLSVPKALQDSVRRLADPFRNKGIDLVLGMEARGFIFGVPVAIELGSGFVPARKPGKLPRETVDASYQLEYGRDCLQVHKEDIGSGMKVLVVDDLLATGGTALAACKLVQTSGAELVGCSFLIELSFLEGRRVLPEVPIHSLVRYKSEE